MMILLQNILKEILLFEDGLVDDKGNIIPDVLSQTRNWLLKQGHSKTDVDRILRQMIADDREESGVTGAVNVFYGIPLNKISIEQQLLWDKLQKFAQSNKPPLQLKLYKNKKDQFPKGEPGLPIWIYTEPFNNNSAVIQLVSRDIDKKYIDGFFKGSAGKDLAKHVKGQKPVRQGNVYVWSIGEMRKEGGAGKSQISRREFKTALHDIIVKELSKSLINELKSLKFKVDVKTIKNTTTSLEQPWTEIPVKFNVNQTESDPLKAQIIIHESVDMAMIDMLFNYDAIPKLDLPQRGRNLKDVQNKFLSNLLKTMQTGLKKNKITVMFDEKQYPITALRFYHNTQKPKFEMIKGDLL